LKIEQTPLEDQQVKLVVELEPEQLEAAKHQAARQIARKAKIPGFRPGKAPFAIVERFAGAEVVLEDAIDILIKDIYPKVIDESGVKPYGPGKLDKVVSTDPPTFEFVVPLEAEVELADYRSLRQSYDLAPIEEKEVERVIESMRQQQAIIEPVDRPAQEGDEVTVKLMGKRKDVEEGDSNVLIRERSVPVVILPENPEKDEDTGEEWPFPGFSRNLIGLSVGDEKTVEYTFPDDSNFEHLRGQVATFPIKVEAVKSRTIPEMTDELAQSLGEYENLEELRKDVRTRLEDRAKHDYEDEYDEKLMDEILKEVKVKYPPQMLEDELETTLHQLEDRLASQKLDMNTYLKSRNMDMEALRKEFTPVAETRLKKMLVLYEIAQKEKIQVSNEAVKKETLDTLNLYYNSLDPKRGKKGLSQALVSNLMSNITADLLVKNTTDRLRSIAKGENPTIEEPAPAGETAEVSAENPAEPASSETPETPPTPTETAVPEAEVSSNPSSPEPEEK
jgi:trigger factor